MAIHIATAGGVYTHSGGRTMTLDYRGALHILDETGVVLVRHDPGTWTITPLTAGWVTGSNTQPPLLAAQHQFDC